jgi:hypothetical protein
VRVKQLSALLPLPRAHGLQQVMGPVPPGAPQEELSAVAPTAGTGIQGRTGSAREDGRPAQPPQRGPGGPAQGVLQRGTVSDFFVSGFSFLSLSEPSDHAM